jgi:hypothetical protein
MEINATRLIVLTADEARELNSILTEASWTANHARCQLCKRLGKWMDQKAQCGVVIVQAYIANPLG